MRSTAELVADLRGDRGTHLDPSGITYVGATPLQQEAADRLTELDAEIAQWMICVRERDVHIWKLDARLARLDARRDRKGRRS